jgi:hypothetical protein
MAGTKLKVAGAAAAIVVAGVAALTIARQDFGPTVTGAPTALPNDGAAVATQVDKRARKAGDKPLWRSLTPAQQAALQPLQAEWNQMDGVRKQKWLQLASRFNGMSPDERERVHERMRAWTKLTPEQRELARETYSRTRKIAPEQKNATWESYQQLPEEQKRKLATAAVRKPSSAAGDAKPAATLNKNVAACPAGTTRNTVSAAPPCVAVPVPPPVPAAPAQPATPPAPAAPPAQQEKPVPPNWGITPNNA